MDLKVFQAKGREIEKPTSWKEFQSLEQTLFKGEKLHEGLYDLKRDCPQGQSSLRGELS